MSPYRPHTPWDTSSRRFLAPVRTLLRTMVPQLWELLCRGVRNRPFSTVSSTKAFSTFGGALIGLPFHGSLFSSRCQSSSPSRRFRSCTSLSTSLQSLYRWIWVRHIQPLSCDTSYHPSCCSRTVADHPIGSQQGWIARSLTNYPFHSRSLSNFALFCCRP